MISATCRCHSPASPRICSSGREVWLREGSVADAVRASVTLPGLLAPQARERQLLVDGGLVNPVPVSLARALAPIWSSPSTSAPMSSATASRAAAAELAPAHRSMAGARRFGGGRERPSLLDVVAGSINIMQVRIARSRLAGEPADVLIAPRLAQVGLFDYHRGEEAIEEGWKRCASCSPPSCVRWKWSLSVNPARSEQGSRKH